MGTTRSDTWPPRISPLVNASASSRPMPVTFSRGWPRRSPPRGFWAALRQRHRPERLPVASTLVLLRHGESEFNAEDRFAGWLDVPLSVAGQRQARRAGSLILEHGLVPDVVFTSPL